VWFHELHRGFEGGINDFVDPSFEFEAYGAGEIARRQLRNVISLDRVEVDGWQNGIQVSDIQPYGAEILRRKFTL